MEQGYASIITAASTLLGLVLVALVFALSSAISRIGSIGDFRHFARWIWFTALGCFLYFTYCIIISFRLRENESSRGVLLAISIAITVLLVASHLFEAWYLYQMSSIDLRRFRNLFILQIAFDLLILVVFVVFVWLALSQPLLRELKQNLYTTLTYLLVLASLRAVVLVGSSFWGIMLLQEEEGGSPEE